MKTRLAKKIAGVTFRFKNWESNYQPYSVPQQRKAISILTKGCGAGIKGSLNKCVVRKVALRYRKCNVLPGEFDGV